MIYTNTHIHTPYSFSSFDTIKQAVRLAGEEQVGVLGINDFNSTEGFPEFAEACDEYGIYPLFNIELAGVFDEPNGRIQRWNDPLDPGVIYLCGKSLNFSPRFSSDSKNLLAAVWKGTQDRIWKMMNLLNSYIQERGIDINLEYIKIRSRFARSALYERHIAKALYLAIVELYSDPIHLAAVFKRLFNEPSFNADYSDSVLMQNEIRNRLFNSGKAVYVEDTCKSYLKIDKVKEIVLESGGIPCYPILGDGMEEFTECEKNFELLAQKLSELGIHAVELITTRNSMDYLKKTVEYFRAHGFCVTLGTEHDTPERNSLIPVTREKIPLDYDLLQCGYEGACILAAHQELHSQNCKGFVDEQGKINIATHQLRDFIRIGDEAIKRIVRRRQAVLNVK